jgi:hypothetical protein
MSTRLWPAGSELRVRFLEGSPDQQEFVLRTGRKWLAHANLRMRVVGPEEQSEIRIAFRPEDGMWSFIGKEALDVPNTLPTMNIGWGTAQGDWPGLDEVIVLRAFGHALGLVSEHLNPNAGLDWNVDAVLYDMSMPPNNWNRAQTENSLLTPEAIVDYRPFDPASVMMYDMPATGFRSGGEIIGGKVLSESDKSFVAQLYPAQPGAEPRPKSDAVASGAGTKRLFLCNARDYESYVRMFSKALGGDVSVLMRAGDSTPNHESTAQLAAADAALVVVGPLTATDKPLLKEIDRFLDRGVPVIAAFVDPIKTPKKLLSLPCANVDEDGSIQWLQRRSWSQTPRAINAAALNVLRMLGAPSGGLSLEQRHTYDGTSRFYNPAAEIASIGRWLELAPLSPDFRTLVAQLKDDELLLGMYDNGVAAVATHIDSRFRLDEIDASNLQFQGFYAVPRELANLGWDEKVPAAPPATVVKESAPVPKPRAITDTEDLQRGRWGGEAERDGRRLEVVLCEVFKEYFVFDLYVQSQDGSTLEGPVIFHLHDTYPRKTIHIRKIRQGRFALLENVMAYGIYTVGAQVKTRTGAWSSLELDLRTLKSQSLPRRFLQR